MYKRVGTAEVGVNFDKYYTSDSVVCKCLRHLDMASYDLVIEPSAGDGAFYRSINHKNKIGLDIVPEHKEIIKQDWFRYDVSSEYSNVLVVGNPPFGKFNKLSSAFIERAFSFESVRTVGFILPNVYKKYTRQRIIPNNWRIKSIVDIGDNAFIFENEIRHIPCSFFIFDKSRGRDLRDNPDRYKDKVDFTFGSKEYFDLFLFGAAPKRIITNPEPNNRGHFIKSKIAVDKLKQRFLDIDWRGLSSASGGVYWLTQGEIVKHYYDAYCV